MRGKPELILAVSRGPVWCDSLSHLVPGIGAAYRQVLALLAHHGLPAATAGGIITLRPDNLVPHRHRAVIDRPGKAFSVEARPWRPRSRALTYRIGGATPRVLQRFHVAHSFGRPFKDCLGLLAITKSGHQHAKNDEHKNQFLPHGLSPR